MNYDDDTGELVMSGENWVLLKSSDEHHWLASDLAKMELRHSFRDGYDYRETVGRASELIPIKGDRIKAVENCIEPRLVDFPELLVLTPQVDKFRKDMQGIEIDARDTFYLYNQYERR